MPTGDGLVLIVRTNEFRRLKTEQSNWPLADDCLEDCHHLVGVRLDDRAVLLRGGYNQVEYAPVVEQFRRVVMMNGGQEFLEFLQGGALPGAIVKATSAVPFETRLQMDSLIASLEGKKR